MSAAIEEDVGEVTTGCFGRTKGVAKQAIKQFYSGTFNKEVRDIPDPSTYTLKAGFYNRVQANRWHHYPGFKCSVQNAMTLVDNIKCRSLTAHIPDFIEQKLDILREMRSDLDEIMEIREQWYADPQLQTTPHANHALKHFQQGATVSKGAEGMHCAECFFAGRVLQSSETMAHTECTSSEDPRVLYKYLLTLGPRYKDIATKLKEYGHTCTSVKGISQTDLENKYDFNDTILQDILLVKLKNAEEYGKKADTGPFVEIAFCYSEIAYDYEYSWFNSRFSSVDLNGLMLKDLYKMQKEALNLKSSQSADSGQLQLQGHPAAQNTSHDPLLFGQEGRRG